MLKCAPIVTPNAVRAALDFAYDCYEYIDHASRGEGFFRREVDFARVNGAMLAGDLKLWGLADGDLRAVAALEDDRLIKYIFVDEHYRRHGLGSALVEAVCDYLREEKRTSVDAYATRASAEFFTALGFSPVGAMEDRWGVDVVTVRLKI